MIKNALPFSATLLFVFASFSTQANASTFDFSFKGPGVSGMVTITYGTTTDSTYSQAFEVTGISGTFSDSNNALNLVNVPIGTLVPINHATPAPGNLLAPNDFSHFPVATGSAHGFLSYDNLFWPGGSPQTATDYMASGGFLDIYGLLFNIGNNQVVDFWSNGDVSGNGVNDYGVAVATAKTSLDYVGGGVAVSPEPSEFVLLGSGMLGLLAWRRGAGRKSSKQ